MKKPEYIGVLGCAAAPDIATAGMLTCVVTIAISCNILALAM